MKPLRAVATAALLIQLTVGVASAHAYVVGAQPTMNGSYENPSGFVAVSFDEPVDVLDTNALVVEDDAGKRVDRHDAAVDPEDATRIVVHVPSLRRGVYVVHWRVVSADTHVVHGAYSIGVGVAVSSLPVETASSFDPSAPLATILRTLTLLAALIAAGAVFLRLLVLDRPIEGFGAGDDIARGAVLWASMTILLTAVPALLVQAAAAGGALGTDIAPTLLRSAWGTAFCVRVASAAALLFAALFVWRRTRLATVLCSLSLLATFSLTGHAVAGSGAARAAAVGSDFAHLVAASTWIGGIFVLLTVLIASPWRSEPARLRAFALLLFANFTPIAMASVCVILATGIYASVVHVGSFADLFATLYGRLVLAKIGLFLVLLALGYRHMKLGAAGRTDSGRVTLIYEAIVALAVVTITGTLIGQMPAAGMSMPGMPPH